VEFWTGTSGTGSGFLVFLYFWFSGTSGTSENYGFTFREFYPLKKCAKGAKEFPRLGCTFLDDF
jgi:hypothetical protein